MPYPLTSLSTKTRRRSRTRRTVGRTRRTILAGSILGLCVVAAPLAKASPYLWQPGGATGGSGLWDLTTLNWFDVNAAAPSVWPSALPSTTAIANFGGTASGPFTVELGAPVTANGLVFDVNGYTVANDAGLAAETLKLASATSFIQVTNVGDVATISAVIDGTSLTKLGKGSLILASNANTLTGDIVINDGALVISKAAQLGTGTTAISINGLANTGNPGFSGGSLVLNGGATGSGITLNRDISLSGRGPGAANATGALVSIGNNTLAGDLTIANPVTETRIVATHGVTTITGGVQLGAGGGSVFYGNGNFVVSGVITGYDAALQDRFIKTGTTIGNTLWLQNNNNNFAQPIRIDTGTIRVGGNGALGVSTSGLALDMNGGLLEVRTDAPDFETRSVNIRGTSATWFVDHAIGTSVLNQNVVFGGTLSNSAANATISLNGRNGYSLTLGNGGTMNWPTGNPLTINNAGSSGTLTINETINHLSETTVRNLTFTSSGEIFMKGDLLQVAGGAAVSLVKNNAGMLLLQGSGTATMTGTTTVNAGTLAIGSFDQLPTGQLLLGNTTTTSGALIYTGTGEISSKAIALNTTTANAYLYANGAGALTLNGTITALAGNKTLVLGGASTADNEIQSNIPNSTNLSLQKIGSGTWVLSGANAFTGGSGVTISGGTLKLKDTFAGTSRDVIGNANALVFNVDTFTQAAGGTLEYVGAAGGASSETLGTLTATAGAGTIKVTPGAGGTVALTFGALGAVANGTGINVATPGAVTLTGTSGFVNPRIYVGGADFAYSGTSAVLLAPQYDVDSGFATAGAALIAGSHNLVTANTSSDAPTVKSLKIGGGFTVDQTGLLTIQTGANSAGGIIQAGGAGTISGTGLTTAGSGDLAIRVDGSTDQLTLSAPITSTTTGGLTKSGAGTLVLSGANTHAGTTTINEGTLQLSGAGTLGAVTNALTIRQDGTLDLNGVGTSVGVLSGAGLIVNATSAPATLNIGSGTSNVFTGQILETAGRIGLSKAGTGTLSLTGLNDYTGQTVLGGGVLAVTTLADLGQPSSIGRGSAVDGAFSLTLGGGAVLQYTGSNSNFQQATQTPSVSTNRLFALNGNATLDSSGQFGNTVLTGGAGNNAALVFSNTGAIGFENSGAKTLTLQGNSAGDNTLMPQLVDNTNDATPLSLTKTGAGLWLLGNTANSYSGNTTIAGGYLQVGDDSTAATRTLPTASALVIGSGTGAGVLQSSGLFTRPIAATATPGSVTFGGTTGGGGFSGSNSKLTVNLGGNGDTLTWGGGGFVGTGGTQTLFLSSATAISDVELVNGIDLNVATGAVTRTIQVDDNGNTNLDFATLSGVISNSGAGSSHILKQGSGTLILGDANTYNGNTTVTSGSIVVGSVGAAGATASSLGTNVGGGILSLGNASTTGANLLYVGVGEVATRTVAINTTTATVQFDASGSGPLVLSSITNAVAGAKTLQIRGMNTDANMITSTLADNGGALTLSKADGGVWILNPTTGPNTYTGNLNVSSGTLGLTANSIGSAAAVRISNAAISAYGGPLTISRPVGLVNNSAAVFAGTNNITIDSDVTKEAGANDQTFSNNLEGGALLTINGDFINAQATAGTRNINIRGYGSTIWNGAIQNNSSTSLTKFDIRLADTASFTLGGANTLTGGILLGQGTLIVANPAGLGPVANNIILDGGVFTSTLDLTGANAIKNRIQLQGDQVMVSGDHDIEFAGPGGAGGVALDQNGSRFLRNEITGGKTLTISGQVNLTVDTNARTLTVRGAGDTIISGVVANGGTGASGLAFSGLGSLLLTGTNTATGALTVNRNAITLSGTAGGSWNAGSFVLNPIGTIRLDNSAGNNPAGRMNDTGAINGSGGTLELIGSPTGTSETAGALTLNSVQSYLKMTDNTGGVGTNSLTFASITFANTGSSLNLTGVPNLGTTNLVKSTAAIPANGLINGVMPRTFISGGNFATYDATRGVTAFTSYNPTSTADLNLAAAADTVEVNAAMTNTALTAPRTFNALKINGNGLEVTGGGRTLTLGAAALLNTGGDNALSPTIINFNAGVAHIQVDPGTTLTVNGALAGTGGWAKSQAGTLVLNSPTWITSTTNLLRGTMKLNGGLNTLFPGQLLNINDGATLDLNGQTQFIGQLSDPGVLPESGGLVTSSSGTGTLITNMATGSTLAATNINGNVNFGRVGGNTLTLESVNTYTGETAVLGGTMTLQDDATILNTSSILLSAATLSLNNNSSLQRAIYDRVGDTTPITLRAGTISFSGKVSDPATETMGAVNAAQGANGIVVATGGTGTAGAFSSADVTFASLSRGFGATVNFSATNMGLVGNNGRIYFTAPLTTTGPGVLGPWAIANSTDFAAYNATNGVGAVGTGGFAGYTASFGSGEITQIGTGSPTPFNTTLTGNQTTGMLRIGGAFQHDIQFASAGDTLNLELGGLLRQNNALSTTIGTAAKPGVLTAGGIETGGNRELVIYTNSGNNPTFGGGSINVATTVVTISSTQGLIPGMTISNGNFPADTKVVSIDSPTQITVSRASINPTTQTNQTFTAGSFISGVTSTGSPTISTNSTTGVVPGMAITGTNIPTGTFVVSVDSPTQLTLSQNATNNSTTGSFSVGLGNVIVNCVIADNGHGNHVTLVKSGGGALNLAANNTYSGGTIVSQGTINLIGSGIVVPAGGIDLDNAAMIMNLNAGQIDASNDVRLHGSSFLTLTGSNTLRSLTFNNNGGTGNPTVTIGTGNTLTLTGHAPVTVTSLNGATIPVISGGTLIIPDGANALSIDGPTFAGQYYANLTPALSITSNILNPAATVTKSGSGLLQLSGQNTFSGLDVTGGGIMLSASTSTSVPLTLTSGPLGTGVVNMAAGTSFVLDNNSRIIANAVSFAGNPVFSNNNNGTPTLTLNGALNFATLTTTGLVVDVQSPFMNVALAGPIANISAVTSIGGAAGPNSVTRTGPGNISAINLNGLGAAVPINVPGLNNNSTLSLLADGDGSGAPETISTGVLGFDRLPILTIGRSGNTLNFAQAAFKTIAPAGITMLADGLTLTANNGYGLLVSDDLALNNGAVFNIAGASSSNAIQALTLTGVISGAATGFTKSNSGTMVLANGANTFGGAGAIIDVTGGYLAVAEDSALGNAQNTIRLSANSTTQGFRAMGTFATSHTFSLNAANVSFEVTGGNTFTLNSAFALPNAASIINKNDRGVLELAANNSGWNGVLNINQGAVLVSHANGLGSATGATVINTLIGQLQIGGGISLAEPINIPGAQNQTYSGIDSTGAIRNVSGTNTITAPITQTTASNTDAQMRAVTITADAGTTLNLTGGLAAVMATSGSGRNLWWALGGEGTGNITGAGITFTGGSANNFLQLAKIGGGTWNLQVANGFSGHQVYVEAGTLSLNGAGSFGAPGTGGLTASNTIFLPTTGTLELENGSTNVNNRLGSARNIDFRGGSLALTGNAGADTTETITGAVTFNIGRATITLTPDAASQLNFTTGPITRNGGGVALIRGTGLGSAAADGVATAQATGAGYTFIGQTATSGTNKAIIPWAIVDTSANGNGISFATANTATSILRPLAASEMSLDAFAANANVSLSAAPITAARTMTINSLTLNGSSVTLDPRAAINLDSGGLLAIGSASTLSGGVLSTSANRELVVHAVGDLTISSALARFSGGLSKSGPGTLTLSSPSNYYTGNNYLNQGVLKLAGGDNTLYYNSALVLQGGALDLNGSSQHFNNIQTQAATPTNGNLVPETSGFVINTAATQATLAIVTGTSFAGSVGNGNPAQSNIALVKSTPAGGTSDWNIYSPNTYTGPTIFNGGRTQLLGTATLSGTSSIELSHATLLLGNNNTTSIGDVNLNDRINDAAPILLRGGMLQYRARFGEIGSETFGAVTIAEGTSMIDIAAPGTGINESNAYLASLNRPLESHGIIRFLNMNGSLGSNAQLFITQAPTLTNNLIGGWALSDREFASYNITTGVASLNSQGYAGYSPALINDAGANDNVRIALPTAGSTPTLTGDRNVYSLALNATGTTTANSTLDLGGHTLTLGSGGFIAAPITDNFGLSIVNGNLTSGVLNQPSELFLHALSYANGDGTNNPANRDITFGANLVDNGTGAVTLVIHGNEGRGTGAGTNEVFLTGANTYTGGTFVDGGTIVLKNSTANGGSITAIPGDLTITGGTTNNNGNFELRQTTVRLDAPGQIRNTAYLTLRGSSSLLLNGFDQSFSGISFINGGGNTPTLNLGAGTLTLHGNIAASSSNLGAVSTISSTGVGVLNLAGATRTLAVDPVMANGVSIAPLFPTLHISATVAGTGGEGLVKTGAGLLQLSGQSTFSGGVDLQAGGIIIGANSTPTVAGTLTSGPLGTGVVHVASGTRLLTDNASRTVANDLIFAGNPIFDSTGTSTVTLALNGAITLPNGVVTIAVPTANFTASMLGQITNIGSISNIVKTGLGNLVFNTAGYTGDLEFNGTGILSLVQDGDGSGNPQTLALGNITFDPGVVPSITVGRVGSTLPLTQAQNKIIAPASITSLEDGLTVTNNNGYGLLVDDNFALNPGAVFNVVNATASNLTQGLTLAGTITSTNALTKTGNGTLVLAGDNSTTLTGPIAVNQGVLSVSADNQLGAAANGVNVAASGSAALRVTDTFSTARLISFINATTTNNLLDVATGETFTLTGANALIVPNGFVKGDNGTLEIAAAQNFPGTVTINSGTVKVSNPAALGTTAATIVPLQGGALQLNGVNIGNELLTLTQTGLNNGGALQAVGTGASTVSGLITLTGATTIGAANGATLNVGGGFSGGQALTLNTLGAGAINFTGAIGTGAVPASITKIGEGTATVSAASAGYTGTLVVAQGNFAFSDAGKFGGTGTIQINPTGTLTVDNTAANVTNRLGGRPVTFLGGTLALLGNATATSSESLGTVTLPSRAIDTVTITPGAGQQANLNLDSISRGANTQGVLLFTGKNLGNTAAANTATVTTTNALTFIGQTATTGTNHGILPYALVEDTVSHAIGFATSDGAGQRLRRLTASEIVTTGFTANANVALGAIPANLAANTTINSLDLGPSGGARLNSRVVLTLNSGGLIARPGNLGLSGGVIVPTNGNDPVFWTLGDLQVDSVISGGNGLTKAGAGLLSLNLPNTYTGNTSVLDGTLKLNAGTNTLFPLQFLIVNGGTLDLNGNTQLVGGLLSDTSLPNTAGTITGSAGSVLITNQDNTTRTFAGNISGEASLARGGQNTLSFTGVSDTTGSLTTFGSTTNITDGGAFTNVSAVRIRYSTLNLINNGLLDMPDRIADSAPIFLRDGVITFTGRAQTDSSETLGVVHLVEGVNTITSNIGGTGINSAQLNLAGFVKDAARAAVNFTGSSLGQLGSFSRIVVAGGIPLTNNMIGAWATTNGTEFATYDSTLGVGPMGSAGFAAYDGSIIPAGQNPTLNIRPTANTAVPGAGATINTLNLAGNVNLTFTGGSDMLNLATGGLLKSGNNANTIGAIVDSGRLTAGGSVTSARADLFVFNNQNTLTINSRIVDNLNGTPVRTLYSGPGTVRLTNGQNSYTGGTEVMAGTLQLDGGVGTVVLPAGGVRVEGATLTMTGAAGQIDPSNVLDLAGSSTVNLFGDNTLAGVNFGNEGGTSPTINTGGILTLNGNVNSTSQNSSFTSILNGRIDLGATQRTFNVAEILLDGNAIAPLSSGLNVTGLVNSPGGLKKTGAGVLMFTGQSIFTGPVQVAEGTLQIGAVNGGSRYSDITVNAGARLNLNGFSTTLGALSGSGVITNSSTTSATLSVGFTNADSTFSGTFLRYSDAAPTAVNLAKVGSGTLTFDTDGAASTTFGSLAVNRGTVAFKGDGTSSFRFAALSVNEGGNLVLDNTGTANVANRLGGGALTLNGGTFRYVGADGATSTETAGTLTLGPSASRIELFTSGEGGASTVTFSSLSQAGGATANVVGTNLGTDTKLKFTTAPALTPATTGILPRVAVNGVDFATYDALKGLVAFTGYTLIGDVNAAGATATIDVGADATVRDLTAARTVNALRITQDDVTISSRAMAPTQGLTLTSGGLIVNANNASITAPVLNLGAEGIFRVNGSSLTVSSAITGTAGLTKAGAGVLVLAAPQAYTGQTALNVGTMVLAGGRNTILVAPNATVPGVSNLQVNGGTFNLNGNDQIVGALLNSNTLAFLDGTITNTSATPATLTSASGSSSNFGSTLAGNLNFTKTGGGNLTLSDVQTYTGATIIRGGTLTLQDRAALYRGVANLANASLALHYSTVNINNLSLTPLADLDPTRIPAGVPVTLNGASLNLTGGGAMDSTLTLDQVSAVNGQVNFNVLPSINAGSTAKITIGNLNRTAAARTVVNFNGYTTNNSGGTSSLGGQGLNANGDIILEKLNGQPFSAANLTNGLIGGWAIADGNTFATYVDGFGVSVMGQNTQGVQAPGFTGTDISAATVATGNYSDGSNRTLTGAKVANSWRLTPGGTQTITMSPNASVTLGVGLISNTAQTTTLQGDATTTLTGAGSELYFYGNQTHTDNIRTRITGAIDLIKSGGATLNLAPVGLSNDYTGGTYVHGGTLALGAAAGLVVIPHDLTINNATVTMSTNAGQIAASANVSINGGGVLNLTGTNTLASLRFDNAGGTGNPTANVSTSLTLSATNAIIAANDNLSTTPTVAGTALVLSGAAPVIEVQSSLSPNGLIISAPLTTTGGGAITKTGPGSLILSGGTAHPLAGGLNIAQGAVVFDNTAATNPYGTGTISLADGVAIRSGTATRTLANPISVAGDFTFGTLSTENGTANAANSLTLGGTTTLSAGAHDLDVNGLLMTATITGKLTGGTNLTKSGPGTLVLSNATNNYGGTTTVHAGTLRNGAANAIPVNSPLLVAAGGTYDLNNFSQTLVSIDGSGVILNTGAANQTLTIGGTSASDTTTNVDSTFEGTLSDGPGMLALVKVGAGTLGLTGPNYHSGDVTISAGTLRVASDASLGQSASSLLLNGGTLQVTGTSHTDRTISFNATASTISVDAGQTFSIGSFITGNGGLTKNGPGTLELQSFSSYAGPVVINGGTLIPGVLGGAGGIGSLGSSDASASNLVINNGGTLKYLAGEAASDRLLTIGSGALGATINASGTGPLAFSASGPIVLGGNAADTHTLLLTGSSDPTVENVFTPVLGGNLSLTKSGTNTWVLLGDNTFTGGTFIQQGTLQLGDGGTTGMILNDPTAMVTVSSGATLAFKRSDDITFNSVITGDGGVENRGPGALTLTKNNTYVGETVVGADSELVVTMNGALGMGAAGTRVEDGGTLRLGVNYTTPEALTLSGSGVADAGALALAPGVTSAAFAGPITIAAPGATINPTTDTATGGTIVLDGVISTAGATVTFRGLGNVNANGVISGTDGHVAVDGVTLGLNAASTYTGDTSIANSGRVVLGAANALPTSTVVTLAGSGTLDLNGFGQTVGGLTDTGAGARLVTNSGATLATLNVAGTSSFGGALQDGASPVALSTSGPGTIFTVTGANTHTGGTSIGAGSTLAIGNAGTTGAIPGSIANDGTLAFNRSDDTSFGGAISGTGDVVKRGANKLIFTGANSSTGRTDIQAGTLELHGTITGDVGVQNGATFDVSHLTAGTYQIAANRILENQGTVGGNVSSDGALTGTGTVTGNVRTNNAGSVAPGVNGLGTLTALGSLSLGAGSSLDIELGGTPLNLSDLVVASAISLSGAGTGVSLNLSLLAGAALEGTGSVFFIANNTGAAAISGLFANATSTGSFGTAFNGESFTLLNDPVGGNDARFAISYDANFSTGAFHGGNDIALMAVPEPTTPATLLAGAAALLGLQRFRRTRRAISAQAC